MMDGGDERWEKNKGLGEKEEREERGNKAEMN